MLIRPNPTATRGSTRPVTSVSSPRHRGRQYTGPAASLRLKNGSNSAYGISVNRDSRETGPNRPKPPEKCTHRSQSAQHQCTVIYTAGTLPVSPAVGHVINQLDNSILNFIPIILSPRRCPCRSGVAFQCFFFQNNHAFRYLPI